MRNEAIIVLPKKAPRVVVDEDGILDELSMDRIIEE